MLINLHNFNLKIFFSMEKNSTQCIAPSATSSGTTDDSSRNSQISSSTDGCYLHTFKSQASNTTSFMCTTFNKGRIKTNHHQSHEVRPTVSDKNLWPPSSESWKYCLNSSNFHSCQSVGLIKCVPIGWNDISLRYYESFHRKNHLGDKRIDTGNVLLNVTLLYFMTKFQEWMINLQRVAP